MLLKTVKYLFLFILISFFSCESVKKKKKYTIVLSQCCDDGWRNVMNQEMQRQVSFHPDLELKIISSYSNSQSQVKQLKSLDKKQVDLLIVAPNEIAPLTPIIEELHNKGIPIILIDRKINSEKYTAFIGADNFEIGYTAGKFLASQFSKGGKIIELELELTSSPALERKRGFEAAVRAFPQLQLAEQIEVRSAENIPKQLSAALINNPQTNIIFSHTDFLARVAHDYLKEFMPQKKLYFMGIDGLPVDKGITDVKNEILNASILYPTGGTEAIQLALKILKGENFNKDNRLVTSIIDKNNAEIMYNQFERIYSQQSEIEHQALLLDDLKETFSSQRNILYITIGLLSLVVTFGAILLYLFREKQYSNKLLAEQNKSINRQKDEIEKVSELAKKVTEEKFRFYSYISHEFKTPLSLILTPTEDLINRKYLDKTEVHKTLNLISKNANRLLRLVNQLLEFRQLDAGKMILDLQVYDLVAFLDEIVNDFMPTARLRNMKLTFTHDITELPMAFDWDKLDKVFFNIISNAFKYTADGGIIRVTLKKELNKVNISVEDNGVGMSEQEKKHAFDIFYRANNNVSLGTGLGLTLSNEFVILHGGEIEVDSEKNKGTIFKISIPIQDNALVPQKNHPKTIHLVETETTEEKEIIQEISDKPTMVIIEDNPDLLQFLKSKFQSEYAVYTAKNGSAGWDLVLSFIPDIIISDVMMPEKNGYELTIQVKEDFRTSHIPVILLTAKGQIENQIEGTRAGADAYFSKPFNQQLLEEKVKRLLENQARMRSRYSNEVMSGAVNSEERKFLIEFEKLIEQGLKDNKATVESLSQSLGMSRVQLYRKITALTDKNVNDYIAEFKIKKAKYLLKNSSKNISEIAYELGFNTPTYFTTFFKQKTGQTPSEWRV